MGSVGSCLNYELVSGFSWDWLAELVSGFSWAWLADSCLFTLNPLKVNKKAQDLDLKVPNGCIILLVLLQSK